MRTRERIDPSQLDIKDNVVSINRVTKVVKGGKNLSFSALVVVGDGHGVVGFGIGKAKEVPSAIKKGIEAAKKNLIRVPMAGTTIPHRIVGTFGAGSGAAEAGARRHRHHRRRRGARRRRGGRDRQHRDQVARLGQRAQRRARDGRRASIGLKDPGTIARLRGKELVGSSRERGSAHGHMANHRTDAKGGTVKVTLLKSPIGFNAQPGDGGEGPRPAPHPSFGGAARTPPRSRGMIHKVRHLVGVTEYG